MIKSNNVIHSIQAMRGIAAVMVVTMHVLTDIKFAFNSDILVECYHIASSYGHAGVDIFFVISGIIMYQLTRTRRYENRFLECSDFLTRRAFRIYPLFWITLVAIIYTQGHFDYSPSYREIFLIGYPNIHAVAWSLPFEVRFYVIIACLMLLFRQHLDKALIGWVVLQSIFIVSAVVFEKPLTEDLYLNSTMMSEFCLGLFVGYLTSRSISIFPTVVVALSIVYFLFSFHLVYIDLNRVNPYREIMFGVPAAMLLYSLITLEMAGKLKISKILHWLGDISYSLYLWHLPILQFFMVRRGPDGSIWSAFLLCVGVFAASLFISSLSYWLLERPTMKMANSVTSRLWGRHRNKIPLSSQSFELQTDTNARLP